MQWNITVMLAIRKPNTEVDQILRQETRDDLHIVPVDDARDRSGHNLQLDIMRRN